jgi:hypothetical protein
MFLHDASEFSDDYFVFELSDSVFQELDYFIKFLDCPGFWLSPFGLLEFFPSPQCHVFTSISGSDNLTNSGTTNTTKNQLKRNSNQTPPLDST